MPYIEDIYDFENLYQSYRNARRGKRYRYETIKFDYHLERNLIQLQNEIIWDTYQQGRYREFYVHEPKKRLIMSLPFRDRVAHWAIYRQLNSFFDRKFIYDSYACRVGKGTHKALDRINYWIQGRGDWYYLKCDVRKFFYRIHHDTMIELYRKHVKDERIIALIERIVRAEDGNIGITGDAQSYNDRTTGRGMAVGNLLSQLSANVYMNAIDQHLKHDMRVKYYARYMDDMLVIHSSKDYLWKVLEGIERFLEKKLKLSLNDKTAIRKVNDGIDWVGYRSYPTHVKLRKSTSKRMKRAVKKVAGDYFNGREAQHKYESMMASYRGIMRTANCYNLERSVKGVAERAYNKSVKKKVL